ncbi:hypothetical protein CkP1_0006 [Citrobacter phage CkP1]|nr:hypothetical protein CkP1_0006 [Citrobacter phage CkP1]
MKFGLTSKKQEAYKKLKIVNRAIGKYKFAWLPVRTVDGSMIWFEKYYAVSEELVSIDKNKKSNSYKAYNAASCQGREKYAYNHIKDAKWTIYDYGNYHYFKITGGNEVLEKLLDYKAELIALINE